MELRPIQKAAIDAAMQSFREGGTYHLLQAPVAFGKTIFSSFLMKQASLEFGAKCLFLAHLKELVVQTVEKFNAVAPELSCGVMCGSLGENEAHHITVGTRQTVAKNLDKLGMINLIIIDEVHLYGPQYQKIVDHFLALNPRLRVVGVTGTPFSLKEGWIYGDQDKGKVWPEPFHSTTMDEMIDAGYLSKYRYKMAADMEDELDGIKKVGGEYNEGDLGEMMQEEHHLGTVKFAIDEYAKDRKSILIFAVTIDHAKKLAEYLGCKAVHSKLDAAKWRERVDRFKSGQDRLLVNVSQLSIGFDSPSVDCVVVARPTMSAALHVQICGRGLRIMEGKEDCLFLDLVGNYLRHGLPSHPNVRKPREKQDEKEKTSKKSSVCPECMEIVEGDELVCPYCGAVMAMRKEIVDRNERLRMEEIKRESKIPKVVKAWEKAGHVTKKGFHGSMFCVRITTREVPLFKFCGAGTSKLEREREKVLSLQPGQKVNIKATAYGDWI